MTKNQTSSPRKPQGKRSRKAGGIDASQGARSSQVNASALPKMQYRITLTSGDITPDGARFFVYITLVGSLNALPEVALNTSAHLVRGGFEQSSSSSIAEAPELVPLLRSSSESFTVPAAEDIGSLDKVILRLEDEAGDTDALDALGWFLERVSVESICSSPGEACTEWAFSVNRWVNRETDHLIELQRAMATEVLLDDRGAKVVKVRLAMHHLPSEPAHEEIYVSGSIPELGCWNVERAVRMEKVLPVALAQKESGRRSVNRNSWHGDWEYCFTLDPDAASDFDYKYFIRNQRTNAMIWEHGPNRKMLIERIAENQSDANVTVRLNDQWNTPTLCRKVLNSYLMNGIMSPLSKILGSSEDGVMAAVRRIRNELEEMRRENSTLRSMLQARSDVRPSGALSEEASLDTECKGSQNANVSALAVQKMNLSQLSFQGTQPDPAHDLNRAGLAHRLRHAREQTQLLQAILEQLRAEARASLDATASMIHTQSATLSQAIERCQRLRDHSMAMWRKEFHWRRKLFNQVQEITGNIRVFCRVRPVLPTENDHTVCNVLDNDKIAVRQKIFDFDRVFGPEHSQEQIYEDTSPLVTCALDGFNVCIFAYGQTGSGKTYTMSGSPESRGVNYRALAELFRLCEERSAAFSCHIQISMLEIYNESLRDLISGKTETRLEIKLGPDGKPYVPDLIWIPVEQLDHVWSVIEAGTRNRSQGATRMNIHSSRSHLIVSIMIEAVSRSTGDKLEGKLHLVDLAGSERVSRSEAEGDRLREAQHINKSLSALGDVFMALLAKQSHVPYRNSKLTYLLQDSLGGDSKTLMFVNVSPTAADETETLSSLMFAQRVAKVELPRASKHVESAQVAKYMKAVAKAQDDIRARDDEIALLRKQIEQLQRPQVRGTCSSIRSLPGTRNGIQVVSNQRTVLQRAHSSTLATTPPDDTTASDIEDDKENCFAGRRDSRRSARLAPAASPPGTNTRHSAAALHALQGCNANDASTTVDTTVSCVVDGVSEVYTAVDINPADAGIATSNTSVTERQLARGLCSPLATANQQQQQQQQQQRNNNSSTGIANTPASKATSKRTGNVVAVANARTSSAVTAPPSSSKTGSAGPPTPPSARRVVLRETRADLLRRQANEAKRTGTPARVRYAFGSRVEGAPAATAHASPNVSRR